MSVETVSQEMPKTIAEASSAQEVHVLDLLIVLSKQRKFIAYFTAASVVLAVITVLLIPSEYTASTLVMPPSQNSSMSSALLGQLGGSGALASAAGSSLGIKNPGDMYVSLFRSRTIADAVIRRFGLQARYRAKNMSDARSEFEDHSHVALGVKDGLITIGVTDHDPKLAADIANGYVDEFRKLSAGLAITEASQRRVFFQQQLLEAKENLTKAEEAMKGMEQSTGVLQVDSQTRALIDSAAALRAQVVAKEVQLEAMRSYATEGNPEMVLAEQQLNALRAQLAKLAHTDQDSGLIVPRGKLPESQMEYIRKLRDVKYYDTVSELIAKQFEMAKLDEARQGAVVQVVDTAVVPDKRSFPKRTLTIILAMFLGFFGACGWCVASEGIKRAKNDPVERQRIETLRASL